VDPGITLVHDLIRGLNWERDLDFGLSEEQQALKETARAFAQKELAALAAGIEASNHPLSHDVVKRMADMGFLGINIPEELGGFGLSNLDALIVLEELAKVSSAVAFPAVEANVGIVDKEEIGVSCVRYFV